jgi:hypothetical protein
MDKGNQDVDAQANAMKDNAGILGGFASRF